MKKGKKRGRRRGKRSVNRIEERRGRRRLRRKERRGHRAVITKMTDRNLSPERRKRGTISLSQVGSRKKLNKMLAKQHHNRISQLRSGLEKVVLIALSKTTMWSKNPLNYNRKKNEEKSNKNNLRLKMQGHHGRLPKLQPRNSINNHKKKTEGKSTEFLLKIINTLIFSI